MPRYTVLRAIVAVPGYTVLRVIVAVPRYAVLRVIVAVLWQCLDIVGYVLMVLLLVGNRRDNKDCSRVGHALCSSKVNQAKAP